MEITSIEVRDRFGNGILRGLLKNNLGELRSKLIPSTNKYTKEANEVFMPIKIFKVEDIINHYSKKIETGSQNKYHMESWRKMVDRFQRILNE